MREGVYDRDDWVLETRTLHNGERSLPVILVRQGVDLHNDRGLPFADTHLLVVQNTEYSVTDASLVPTEQPPGSIICLDAYRDHALVTQEGCSGQSFWLAVELTGDWRFSEREALHLYAAMIEPLVGWTPGEEFLYSDGELGDEDTQS